MKIKEYKQMALKSLSGYWAEATIITLINTSFIAIYILSGYLAYQVLLYLGLAEGNYLEVILGLNKYYILIAVLRYIALFCFASPTFIGKYWCYMQAGKGNEAPINCLFSCYFSKAMYFKCLKVVLLVVFKLALVFIPFAAIAIFEIKITRNIILHEQMNVANILSIIGCVVVVSALIVIFIMYAIKFIAVPNLFVKNPYEKASEIVKRSSFIVKGHIIELLKLILSFIGYMILNFLIFPLMVIMPYFNMTVINAVEYIVKNSESITFDEEEETFARTM